jgi:WD40 repeat protein
LQQQQQQSQAQLVQRRLSRGQPTGAAAAGQGLGAGSSKGSKQGKLLLSKWLQRPNRVIDPKESVWVFCEVLLLLHKAEQAAGPAAVPPSFVRPSKLLLHSSGRISFAPGPAAAAADGGGSGPLQQPSPAEAEEELLYRSPEEETAGATPCTCAASSLEAAAEAPGGPQAPLGGGVHAAGCQRHTAGAAALGPKCYSFSLGVLFFDLFWAPAEGGRVRALQDLRQRVLPSAFLRQRPQEAAFVLALLHPDPSVRPSVEELIGGELLGGVCETLRARHAAREQAEAAQESESLLFFLQTMQTRKQQEAGLVRQQLAALDDSIRAVAAALAEVQGMLQLGGSPGGLVRRGSHSSPPTSIGSPRSQHHHNHQQQQQLAAGACKRAAADEEPAAAVKGDACDEADSDDMEEERREARAKRRRVQRAASSSNKLAAGQGTMPGRTLPGSPTDAEAQQEQLRQLHQAAAAAAAGDSTAVVVPPLLQPQWDKVLHFFDYLEAVFFRRKQRWQQSQQAQGPNNGPAQQQQQQPQQQGGSAVAAAAAPGSKEAAGQQGPAAGPGPPAPDSSAAVARLPVFLQRFGEDLASYTRYSRLALRGYIRSSGDVLGGSNLLCGLGLDRDEEFFATAGVSKRIRVYEYASVVGDGGVGPGGMSGVHYPVLDLTSRSRLSSVVWSSYVKGHLASSDYEGVVQLWDVNTSQELMTFEEHAKRAWSVDFSPCDPSRLVSGSDDGTVKVWSIHQDNSVATINLHANVCSVQFAPDNPHLIAAGSANYRMYLFDLRHTAAPLAVAAGHQKAVSYVRFLTGQTLVTASTDNSLRLWQVPELVGGAGDACELVLRGHTNEKNFIGLAVTPAGYIACGSETNEVYTYYSAVPRPLAHHAFSEGLESDLETMSAVAHGAGASSGQFVSCVAWSSKHGTLLAANSAGHVKVLELV